MTAQTPSDSVEESDTSSGIPTPPSSVGTPTSHHNEPRTSPDSTQGLQQGFYPELWLIGFGVLALIVYSMVESSSSFLIGLAMYILVGVPVVCGVIVGVADLAKTPKTKSEESVPAPKETPYVRLHKLNTKLEGPYLKKKQRQEKMEAQLQKKLEILDKLSARLAALEEQQPVSSGNAETYEPSVHGPQPPIANGDDEDKGGQHWDHSVPWHGTSYMIIEKSTLRAITSYDDIWLEDGEPKGKETPASYPGNTWLCIEEGTEFMFFNKGTGYYLGCRDEDSEPAPIEDLVMLTGEEEGACGFTARAHHRGGYELFLHSRDCGCDIRAVAVGQDNSHLQVRLHGPTLWEFRRVSSS